MAATPAGPAPGQGAQAIAQCRNQNGQIHNETMQLFQRAACLRTNLPAGNTTAHCHGTAPAPDDAEPRARWPDAGRMPGDDPAGFINERAPWWRGWPQPRGPAPGQGAQAIAQCRNQNGQITTRPCNSSDAPCLGTNLPPRKHNEPLPWNSACMNRNKPAR